MSDKFVFEQDVHRRTDMHFDDVDDKITFNTVEDAQPVVDANKRKFNDYGDKLTMGKRGEWHHAARIPPTVWAQLCKETGGALITDKKLLAKYLNDPDNKYFKVSPTNI